MSLHCGINRQSGYIEIYAERISIEWIRKEAAGGWPCGNPVRGDFNWWWALCLGHFEIKRNRSQAFDRWSFVVWNRTATHPTLHWVEDRHCRVPIALACSKAGI